jgi:hypothetical protein
MPTSTPAGAAPHEGGTRTPVVHKPYSLNDFARPPQALATQSSEHTSIARSEALGETLGIKGPIGFGFITGVGHKRSG